MGVIDGQAVNAAVSNPAWINKNINDVMPNLLGFSNPSTPSIADIQKAANTVYTATGASETQPGTNYNATAGTISNGQNHQTALGILANKFDAATGHFHTGTPGDGPILDVVLSLAVSGGSTQTGNLVFIPGPGILITPGVNGFEIAASGSVGVTSIAASGFTPLTGSVLLQAGTNITLSQTGQNILINAPAASSFLPPTVTPITGGSGNYTVSTSPRPPLYLTLEMMGAGGGGGGANIISGTDGGDTTFGGFLTAGGGVAGVAGGIGATVGAQGGTPIVSSPAIDLGSSMGGPGGGPFATSSSVTTFVSGPIGGIGRFAGPGMGSTNGSFTSDGLDNTGGGGAGGSIQQTNNVTSGAGGGSGAYVKAQINSPSGTYTYSVGAKGTGGIGGGLFGSGSDGGSGVIIVREYYQ